MLELKTTLKQKPVIYITRDIERALGLDPDTPGYFIISNSTPFGKQIAKDRVNILLIEKDRQLDTWELLQHPQTIEFINQNGRKILVFKNTKQIERICAENAWQLLNPSAELSNRVEEKISQLNWLGDLKKYLPDYDVKQCKDIEFENEPFILQFNRSHTGSGTILIKSQEQLDELKQKFPNREARIAKYVDGPLFTNNNVATKDKILIGNISYQITGLPPFTDVQFATVGNDWGLPKKYLSEEQIQTYKKIATDVGEKLRQAGWKGAFGIDVVVEKTTGKLFLVEINARQPASTTYESTLQNRVRGTGYGVRDITTFEAHLASLLDLDVNNLIEIDEGAQVILRNTSHKPHNTRQVIEKLSQAGYNVISYDNDNPNSDLLRTQSEESIIEDHNKFNKVGNNIVRIIKHG